MPTEEIIDSASPSQNPAHSLEPMALLKHLLETNSPTVQTLTAELHHIRPSLVSGIATATIKTSPCGSPLDVLPELLCSESSLCTHLP